MARQTQDFAKTSNYYIHVFPGFYQAYSIHKHLPGIPSIDDINGWKELSVGDRDMKLLEKVEELTLYVISLQKQINELKNSK